jgi:hypothetical protein
MDQRSEDAIKSARATAHRARVPTEQQRKVVAYFDLETTGLGKLSTFYSGVDDSTLARMAKKHGLDFADIDKALVEKVGIWEIGYKIGDNPNDPVKSILAPPNGVRMEKGARMMNRKNMLSTGGTLEKLFDDVVSGEVNKPDILKRLSAIYKASEKEGLAQFVEEMRSSKVTHIAGYNSGSYDVPLLVKRLGELGMHKEAEFVAGRLSIDFLDDVNNLVNIVKSPYKNVFSNPNDPLAGTGRAAQPRFTKGQTALGAAAKLFGLEHTAHRAGTPKGDAAIVAQLGPIFERWKKGERKEILQRVNNNIVDWYDYSLKKASENGAQTDVDRTLLRERLVKRQRTVQAQLESVQNWDKDYKQVLGKLDDIDPARQHPTGAELHEESNLNRARIRDSQLYSDVTKGIKGMADKAGQGVREATDRVAPKLQGAWEFASKNLLTKKGAAVMALIGTAALTMKGYKKLSEDRHEDDLLDAGMLGMTEADLRKEILKAKRIEGFNAGIVDRNKRVGKWNSMREGRAVHEQIQKEMGKKSDFVGAEVPVYDWELGIKGMVDAVVKQEGENIPVEIKTVGTVQDLMALEQPKQEHMSQANFYAHALGAQGGFIVYAARDDPERRKAFYQPYSPGQLVSDVGKFRSSLITVAKSDPSVQHYWKRHIESMGWNTGIPAGVRPETRQGYGGKDTIPARLGFGFPGGREQNFDTKRPAKVNMSSGRGRSKIRDQASRNRFSGIGHPKTPLGGNFTRNPTTRYRELT